MIALKLKERVLTVALMAITALQILGQPNNVKDLTGLTYGKYSVGFKYLQRFDDSRNAIAEQNKGISRIVPIYFWYPAQPSTPDSKKLSIRGYLDLWGLETDYDVKEDLSMQRSLENYCKSFFWKSDTASFESLHNSELQSLAIAEAPIRSGQHPLVILIHGPSINWHFIAEYLASHGYAVAYAAVAGSYDKRLEAGISGVETELRDAEFTIGELSNLPEVDQSRIGVIGYSHGSLAGAGLASKNSAVAAFISLDGVVADPIEGESLFELPYFSLHKFHAPLLHINSGLSYSSDLTHIDKLQFSDRYVVELDGMRHADFSGQGLYDELGIKMSGEPRGDYKAGFQMVNKYVLAFFDANLQSKNGSFEELLIEKNNPATKNIAIHRKESQGYDFADLIKYTFEMDFDKLFEVYQANKNLDIKAFSYTAFNDVGMQLFFRGHLPEALTWFGYFSDSYPHAAMPSYMKAVILRRLDEPLEAQKAIKGAQSLMDGDLFLTQKQKAAYTERLNRMTAQLEASQD